AYIKLLSHPPGFASTEPGGAARALFDILIKPIDAYLDRNKPLCIVPDKLLNRLPFATLVSSDSGRFLLEDYSLLVSPSSSLFTLCTEIANKKAIVKDERILCVGNPRFDRQAFGFLDDLPSAGGEAQEVARLYVSSRLLTGEEATPEHVIAEMTKSD